MSLVKHGEYEAMEVSGVRPYARMEPTISPVSNASVMIVPAGIHNREELESRVAYQPAPGVEDPAPSVRR